MSNSYVRMYETKLVRRNYLHLYRCFGWLPVSKIDAAPHDWERIDSFGVNKRRGFLQTLFLRPNKARASTMPNDYYNLSDPNDVGQRFYEMTLIRRNVKYHEKGEQSKNLKKHERKFDHYMWYMKAHHVFWCVVLASPFFLAGLFTLFVGLMALLGLGNFGIDFIDKMNAIFTYPVLEKLNMGQMAYGICAVCCTIPLHIIARWITPILPASKRYEKIKNECFAARDIVREIQLDDVSLMNKTQRQRYERSRVIGSAVSNAMLQGSKGMYDDFYIGS